MGNRDDEVTESGVCIFLVRGKSVVKALFKPIERTELDHLVRRFMQPLEDVNARNYQDKLKSFDLASGKQLSDLLLGDILPGLPSGMSVIIVPDGSLGVIPFEMLVLSDGGKIVTDTKLPRVFGADFFGDRNPISYTNR